MGRKLKDNITYECKLRRERDQARKNMENSMGPKSTSCRNLVKKCKDEGVRIRASYRSKNMRKTDFLVRKYKKIEDELEELNEEDQEIIYLQL